MDTNTNFVPNGRRHFEFFTDLDALLLEQEAENARLHELAEQNGTELSEEELVWEAFRRSKE